MWPKRPKDLETSSPFREPSEMVYGQRSGVLGTGGVEGSGKAFRRATTALLLKLMVKKIFFRPRVHDLEIMGHECIRLVPDVLNDVVTKFW